MNLAIFGGSFDPPHKGHLAIIESLCEMPLLDKIIVLPAFGNPLKDSALFPADTRLAWLESICANKPKVAVSSHEITQGAATYTIDSISHFKSLYSPKRVFLVIGADIIAELPKWRKFGRIINEVDFIIATRNPYKKTSENPLVREKLAHAMWLDTDIDISSREIRAGICGNFKDSRLESQLLTPTISTIKRFCLEKRLAYIMELLDSKKASNLALFDLSGSNYITQFVIIATSLADKHSFALLDTLKTELKARGEVFYATDEESGDWIIADLGDIMVHIFTENHRKKFNLEEFLTNYRRENSLG